MYLIICQGDNSLPISQGMDLQPSQEGNLEMINYSLVVYYKIIYVVLSLYLIPDMYPSVYFLNSRKTQEKPRFAGRLT